MSVGNIVLLNVGWFACVLGAAAGSMWLGPGVVAAVLAANLAAWSRDRGADLRLFAGAMALGLFVDSALALAGAIESFSAGWGFAGWLSPAWMVVLWANLAAALNHSLEWLKGRPILSGLFGFVGGAGSYYAGMKLGALELSPDSWFGVIAVGVVWAAAMPALVAMAERLGGPAARASE